MKYRRYLRAIRFALLCAFAVTSTGVLAADLDSDLLKATKKGDTQEIRRLLAAGADVDAREVRGNMELTALFKAAEKGHLDAVRLLLDKGASKIAYVYTHDLADDLRDAAEDGELHKLRSLLEAGVPPDLADRRKRTALMFAAKKGRVRAVELLINTGANLSLVDNRNESALDKARSEGKDNVVRALEAELARLREEERESLRETAKHNEDRLVLLGTYETGGLTLDTFLDHGWNAYDPFVGKIGILGIQRNGDTVKLIIGMFSVSFSQAIQEAARDQNAMISRMLRLPIDSVVDVVNVNNGRNTRRIAHMTFKRGILDSMKILSRAE